jgi:hypothetical protein
MSYSIIRPYDQIELLSPTQGNPTPTSDKGEYVDLPFLDGRYNWYALMSVPRETITPT